MRITKTYLRTIVFAVCATAAFSVAAPGQTPAKADDNRPKYALLVGISQYKSPALNRIDGCDNNVPLLAQTLTDGYGFPKDNVLTLMNDRAGKDAIIAAFKSHLVENAREAKQLGKEAVIVYYFCGHGSQYPDQDGDENDGLDETFVAYDSRTGTTPDILDDEIDDLKADLRQLTTNTTLILESCHSGTGSRGGEELISEEAEASKQSYAPYKRRWPPSTDADAGTYTEIAASASSNTAKSESKEFCNCDKPYSLMTKALVEALNRASFSTTYRGLVREVSAAVGTRSPQDPQVEGNRDTILFGGAAKRTKPYIEISRLLTGDQAVIKAGTIHGLKEGSQVAVYAASSNSDAGDSGWLTNGIVAEVGNFESVVQFPSAKTNENVRKVEVSSHVVLTSPVFGGGPVLVALDTAETAFSGEVKETLTAAGLIENQLVAIVEAKKILPAMVKSSRGVVRLRKDKFSVAFPPAIRPLARLPKPAGCSLENGVVTPEKVPVIGPDTEVYYLDDGNPGGTPLFGRVFLPGKSAASEIAQAIRNYALRTNLETLNNAASTLPVQVSLSVNKASNIEIVENCTDGRLVPGLKSRPSASDFQPVKDGRIPAGSVFNFKIKNISGDFRRKKDEFAAGEAFYVAAIYLRNNGDIDVIYPRLGAKDPLGDGIERSFGGYIASKPGGAEHLIVIVSRSFVDFSFYESTIGTRSPQSILERLLNQSGSKSRSSGTLVPDAPDSWGVVRIDLKVAE